MPSSSLATLRTSDEPNLVIALQRVLRLAEWVHAVALFLIASCNLRNYSQKLWRCPRTWLQRNGARLPALVSQFYRCAGI
ncbi:MAG TPA: hypothetical protein VIT21_13340 [Chthoniobacterales bacterium]